MLDRVMLQAAVGGSVDERLTRIEANQERLYLLCTVLTELLRDKGLLTEAELLEKLREVDLRDGVEDGKFGGVAIIECPTCKRKLKSKHRSCFYCGSPLSG